MKAKWEWERERERATHRYKVGQGESPTEQRSFAQRPKQREPQRSATIGDCGAVEREGKREERERRERGEGEEVKYVRWRKGGQRAREKVERDR